MDLATVTPPGELDARMGEAVRVHAPGRLHLGFFDPGATLGRRFGSLGLVIEGCETVVELAHGREDAYTAHPQAAAEVTRARSHVETLRRATRCRTPLALYIHHALPAHAGPWLRPHSRSPESHSLLVLDALTGPSRRGDLDAWRAALETLDERWIEPVMEGVTRGHLAECALVAPGHEGCERFELSRAGLYRLWRRPRSMASLRLSRVSARLRNSDSKVMRVAR